MPEDTARPGDSYRSLGTIRLIGRRVVRLPAGGVLVGALLHEQDAAIAIPPLPPEVAERVVTLTPGPPPRERTHWTAGAGARRAGVSPVRHIWRAHGLQPYRIRRFKLSDDPHFAVKADRILPAP